MARLIDSSVAIAMERLGLTAAERLEFLRPTPIALASVTVSEILIGLYRPPTGRRRTQRQEFIEELIAQFPVLPFDLDAARAHASILDQLRRGGQTVGLNDTLIAAIALANECIVVTDNLRDFERIPGLVVERPTWLE